MMENFPTQRYEAKIEAFDHCLIEGTNQQEVGQTSNSDDNGQEVNGVENDQNNEVSSISPNTSQIQQNNNQTSNSMTLTPVRLPAILDGEFFNVTRLEDTNVTARCLQCQKLLNGSLKSTGNFLSHIKRVHPSSMEKIKCKSNQRRPAAIFIDLSAEKCSDVLRAKKLKKFKAEQCQSTISESIYEHQEWQQEPPLTPRKRKSEELENNDALRSPQNNSVILEDEFDAVGKNVAAKLRHMRLDQRIIAEKLINDILFEAQLGNLHRDSNIQV